MTTTFVTFYIDLEQKDPSLKQTDYRFECFERLVKTGVPICLFVSQQHRERAQVLASNYSNLFFMGELSIADLQYEKCAKQHTLSLPPGRNLVKDTYNYLVLQNSKLDCIKRVILKNPFNTCQFAWIDFSIFHIVKNEPLFIQYLLRINKHITKEDTVYIPGCTAKIQTPQQILERPNWRFCGGFFLGTAPALEEMYECIEENLDSFFTTYKQTTWEVNLWAYCETFCGLNVKWFKADHNESILHIPSTELRVESYADIYYLAFPDSERDIRMKERFTTHSIRANRIEALREDHGCMLGHLRMIRAFYETSEKEFGVFMEDDVYLRKGFQFAISRLCETMIEKDLDVLLIGYLLTYSPRNSSHFPVLATKDEFTFHSFPDDTWGTQGYILSRAQAAYILEKFNLTYLEREPIYHLDCFASDWTITKRGKRALVYPMVAVEEGVIESSHIGQQQFHRQSKEFNYDPEKYI